MNDSEQVVFTGSDSGGDAIYRNGGLVFVRDDQAVTGGTIRFSPLQRPGHQQRRPDCVCGSSGPSGHDRSERCVHEHGRRQPVAGHVERDRSLLAQQRGERRIPWSTSSAPRTGVYLGRPGAIAQPVAPENGSIDGTTLNDAFVWEKSLNDLGQIAFWAHLASWTAGRALVPIRIG